MKRPMRKSLFRAGASAGILLLHASLAGCTGELGGSAPEAGVPSSMLPGGIDASGPGASTGTCAENSRLPSRIGALNGVQYLASIEAAFPGAAEVTNPFSNSDRSAEYSTNAELRRFDFNTSQTIRSNALSVAKDTAAQLSGRFSCLKQAADSVCATSMIKQLGRELYREPLAEREVTKLAALFEQARVAAGASAAAELVLRAMLSSPHFLFQKQLGAATGEPNVLSLTSHELAGAIAFTLTNAPPDKLLRDAADSNSLQESPQIATQVERVLALPEGQDGLKAFLGELFRTRDLPTQQKDLALFPGFDAEARSALLADFSDTIGSVLRSASPTFTALLTTRDFVIRPRTAALMGWTSLQGLAPEGSLAPAPEPGRMGLLTHPALMATFAHADETNPVARGHFISSKLLGVVIPPPPKAVMFPEPSLDAPPQTLRQLLQTSHSVEGCAGCHQFMDAVGYPFEAFDAVGKFRTTDNGLPIDTSGTITGSGEIDGTFQNAEEMLQKIAASKLGHDRFTGNVFKYVAGIDESPSVYCTTTGIAGNFKASGGDIPRLIVSLLTSPEFRSRAAN